MGKRKGGGGGGGGGGGYNKGRGEDITSARGSGCVIATCNVAREREGSRELVTLLTQMIEKEYPTLEEEKDEEKEEGDESQRELSAEEMMRKEVEGLKSKTSTTQAVVSLQTGVKGVVFVKIRKRHICPVRLVRALFAQVEADGLPLSRHLVRIVPLQRVFFPDEQELTAHVRAIVGLPALQIKKAEKDELENEEPTVEVTEGTNVDEVERAAKRSRVEEGDAPIVEETVNIPDDAIVKEDVVTEAVDVSTSVDVEPIVEVQPPVVPGPPLTYNFTIKIRNHDTLKKNQIIHCVTSTLPRHRFHYNYKEFKGMFVVNIFKNIAGISIIEDYDNMLDFNIAKHQDKHSKSLPSTA